MEKKKGNGIIRLYDNRKPTDMFLKIGSRRIVTFGGCKGSEIYIKNGKVLPVHAHLVTDEDDSVFFKLLVSEAELKATPEFEVLLNDTFKILPGATIPLYHCDQLQIGGLFFRYENTKNVGPRPVPIEPREGEP